MVRGIARHYEIPGMEVDDVEQEGLIALLEAARRYDPNRGTTFKQFASRVVNLRLDDAWTKATRLKHGPLNTAVVTVTNQDGAQIEMLRLLPDPTPDPSEVAIAREDLEMLAGAIHHDLTAGERTALLGVMNERPYREIADDCGMGGSGTRYVDNAVQRARRKLRIVLSAAT